MGWGGRLRLILTMKSWVNMMNEEMLLTNIYVRSRIFSGLVHSACGLSCWCFSVTGEKLFFSTCPDEQEFLLFLRSSGCLDYATGEQVRRDRPVILSDSIGIIWGAEYMWKNGAPEELIMIGPIFNSSSSFRSIETALHRLTLSQQARNMLLEKMKKIPVLSMANFGQYVQMLHYMLFQEEIQRQEFQFQTVIEDGKNIYHHLGDEMDADGGWDSTNVERIHMTEETLLQMIREGNLEYKNVLDRLTGLELPAQFPAEGQFRRLKNALMIFCGQCTRAAIQGGMPQQTAFAMETEHCDRLERAATMTDLLTVNRRMMEDYIRKVHDLRATPDVSKPVQQCCDYIRRHILQPLELSQIARHVGYSEYYLSKRFNREMGIRVVDFIKDERINLAKIWLVTTSKSVDEISETLQFNSRNYFGKVFCEKVGMTPSAYRKQLRAQEEENQ